MATMQAALFKPVSTRKTVGHLVGKMNRSISDNWCVNQFLIKKRDSLTKC